MFRVLGVIALLIASFQAWNTQYELARQNDDRLATKDLIATAIGEDEELIKSHKQSKEQSDADVYSHDASVWATKTATMIEAAYDNGEVAVFASDAGLMTMNTINYPTGLIRSLVANRLQRLNELTQRVESTPIRRGRLTVSGCERQAGSSLGGEARHVLTKYAFFIFSQLRLLPQR